MTRPTAGRRLDAALAKLATNSEALTDLASVWPRARSGPYWWDDYFRVFTADGSHGTVEGLFGALPTLRALLNPRGRASRLSNARRLLSMRRVIGPIQLDLPLPPDSVVLPPDPSKNGVVVASRAAGLLLKVTYDREGVKKELESWEIARSAGIEAHLSRVLDHGSTRDGGRWVLSQFVPNTDPPDRPVQPLARRRRIWLDWMRWRILPLMERFYQESGLEVDAPDIALERLRSTFDRDRMPEEMLRVVDLADTALSMAGRVDVLTATLHKDLIPRHVHRHGQAWWVLDWGSTGRGVLCKDSFREYFWRSLPGVPKHRAFWAWLRGDLAPERLPGVLRSEIDLYLDWHSEWRRTPMTPHSLRFQLLLAFLGDYHDVIVQYDLANRLPETETTSEFPAFVRTLVPQLRSLGVV